MTFNEMVLTTEKATSAFDKLFDQCVTFAEASYQEYKTNLKEAELKVIQESGTTEDLIYLENAAKEGFIVRAGKTISKIVDGFLSWLKSVIEAIQSFFTNAETKKALDNAEKAIKNNPKLKSQKIEVVDLEKVEKVSKEHEAMINRKLAMFKAKKFSEDDLKELENIEKSYDKKMKTAKAATTTIALAAAVPTLGLIFKNLKKRQTQAESDKKNSQPKIDENTTPQEIGLFQNFVTLGTRVQKDFASLCNSQFGQIFKDIKKAVTGKGEIEPSIGKEKDTKAEVKKESVTIESSIDDSTYLDDLITEIEELTATESTASTEEFDAEAYLEALEATLPMNDDTKDLEAYLEALEKEILGDDETAYEESATEEGEDMITAEEYLEAMEAELFDDCEEVTESEDDEFVTAEEYLESMESELFDDEDEITESEDDDELVTADEYLEAMEAELFEDEE